MTEAEKAVVRRAEQRKELSGIAMLGLLSGDCAKSMGDVSQSGEMPLAKVCAITAVAIADAMIAELDKQVDQGSKPPEDVL